MGNRSNYERRNVMVYVKPGINENDIFQWVTQAFSEKEIPSSPNRSRTYDLPITRLVGVKAIKHPAYRSVAYAQCALRHSNPSSVRRMFVT